MKRTKGRAKISARSGRAIQIVRVRAGFEPSVARVIVEDNTVSRPIDRFLFQGLHYQAQDLATRRGSNPARSNDIWWHISSAPRFSPYLWVSALTERTRSLRARAIKIHSYGVAISVTKNCEVIHRSCRTTRSNVNAIVSNSCVYFETNLMVRGRIHGQTSLIVIGVY